MSFPVCNSSNVKVYRVAGSAAAAANLALPRWLAPSKKGGKRSAGPDSDGRGGNIELIQDFGFPEASYRIKTTRDGQFAMSTGVYKPHIRVFEFSEMSMKLERHTDSENVDFVFLGEDWTKSAHLQADRTVQLHSRYGLHHTVRIPRFGRAINYHAQSCDLLVAASGPEVYRINLELGQFVPPFATQSPSINALDGCAVSQLIAFGGSDGCVEIWDARLGTAAIRFALPNGGGQAPEITALAFRQNGIDLGVGTSVGTVLLYDLRHPAPSVTKDHMYGEAVHRIVWHDRTNHVVTADRRCVRIWDAATGAGHCTVEPPCDINDVCVVPDSGLIFVPAEDPQIHAFLLPSLGPAPRFCSFLDNLTEEMAVDDPLAASNTIYENYKFVTRKELRMLNLEHVIGTSAAKAYMHGYFIHQKLHEKAKLIANPFAYDEYRANLVRSKIDAKRGSRISSATSKRNKKVKINQAFADKLGGPEGVDSRFGQVFSNEDFFIDEECDTFKLINPTPKSGAGKAFRERAGESSEEEDYQDCKPVQSSLSFQSDGSDATDSNSSAVESEEDKDDDEEAESPRKAKQAPEIKKKKELERIVPVRRPERRIGMSQPPRNTPQETRHTVVEIAARNAKLRKQSFGTRLQENKFVVNPGLASLGPRGSIAMRFTQSGNRKNSLDTKGTTQSRPFRRKFTRS